MGLGLEIPVKTGIRRSASKQSPGCARLGVEEGRLTRGAHLSVTEARGLLASQRREERGKESARPAREELGRQETGPSAGAGEEEGGGIWLGLSGQKQMEGDVSPFFVLFSFI